jgi:hypothetical protein
LFLLVPLTIAVAAAIDALLPRSGPLVAAALVSLMFGLTAAGYFRPLMLEGGHSEASFRTGQDDPKTAAAGFIRAHASGETVVLCNDWWSYWPLRFLLHNQRGIAVGLLPTASFPPGITEHLPPVPRADTTYIVLFDGDSEQPRGAEPVFTARDPRGRAILNVFESR